MKNDSSDEEEGDKKTSAFETILSILLICGGLFYGFSNLIDLFDKEFSSQVIQAERSSLSYDEMMKRIYSSGLTSAQEAKKKSDFSGKRVTWIGTVNDVEPSRQSYTVELSDGEKRSLTDYYLEDVPESQALSLSRGDVIRFSGTITGFTDGVFTGYVHLTDAKLK